MPAPHGDMICAQWTEKLDAYLDGAMPGRETAEVEEHLRGCPACASESLRRLQWKWTVRTAGERYVAETALRERVQEQVSSRGGARRSRTVLWRPSFAVAALAIVLLAAALLLSWDARRERNREIVGELADLHVATMAAATPVDVVSSDRHTVKPWFEGKIPFTFNLPDLAGSPFVLVGGRVSYLQQAPGAELLFRVRKHQISVFIFRDWAATSSLPKEGALDARSFRCITWRQGELRYFVIGDTGAEDLEALRELLERA